MWRPWAARRCLRRNVTVSHLIVDEMQSFTSETVAAPLAAGRKYATSPK